jgi:hypothetical protein
MRCHILSDADGAVLALEMPTPHGKGNDSGFMCKTPQHSCHDIDLAADMFDQLKADGWQMLSRLRIVEIDGQTKLVA